MNTTDTDGRKLNHKTLEEIRIRAVRRVEAGESPETVIQALGNPFVDATTMKAQCLDINTGKVKNWKEVGGLDQSVSVITSRKESATSIMFKEIVMNNLEYSPLARKVKTTREEINMVSYLNGGIGALSYWFVKMNPRKLKVVKTDEIVRPLSFITKGAPIPIVRAVIDYLRTDNAKMLFR
ncbi:MAG: hypothetical protein H7835_17440 [Magnetococcus sp. XQGC-1]